MQETYIYIHMHEHIISMYIEKKCSEKIVHRSQVRHVLPAQCHVTIRKMFFEALFRLTTKIITDLNVHKMMHLSLQNIYVKIF